MSSQTNVKKLALSAVLASLAIIFGYIEGLMPSVGIPGVKLGLANLVILIALYGMSFKHAFCINVIRILVAGLLFKGPFGALYALAGGILSICIMGLLKKTDRFSMIGVSMAGGAAHNLGQLCVAVLVMTDTKLFLMFPVLLFSGIVSGILIGIVSYVIFKNMPKRLKKEFGSI